MEAKLRNTIVAGCAIIFLIVGASPLPAYVLQGRHVLELVIANLGRADSLFVSEKLIFYPMTAAVAGQEDPATGKDPIGPVNTAADDGPAVQNLEVNPTAPAVAPLEVEGTLRYVFGRAFRSDAGAPESERIHIAAAGRTLTIIDGSIVPETVNRFNLFKDILLYRSREALAERLLQLGIDVSITSLGRFEDKIAFVIGANYPDESVNQLWVDKETLLPLRLIVRGITGADSSDKVEIRYLIWWKIGKTQYPSRIEFYQDDDLARVSQAISFEVDAVFSEELFNIDRLETMYPRGPRQPITAETAEEPSEIQKTIDDFKRIFE